KCRRRSTTICHCKRWSEMMERAARRRPGWAALCFDGLVFDTLGDRDAPPAGRRGNLAPLAALALSLRLN
ncbi:MAG: hypothetical protein E6501_31775, partial [Bradyrhizobium sp.]|nr:hypothetical protein [Bradyrhizobium sp.]